jgi:hypothetical protein
MIDRISEITTGVLELARAECELALAKARTTLLQLALIVMGLTLATISISAMLVSATWAIADELGWIAALAIVGSAGAVIALTIITLSAMLVRSTQNSEATESAMQRANKATLQIEGKSQLAADLDRPDELKADHTDNTQSGRTNSDKSPSEHASLKGKLLEAVLEHPAAVAGGALTVVSLLGPSKTLRLIGRTTMLAGLASSALDKLKESDAQSGRTA